MKIADRDLDERVFIVAEIGNNHEGSFALAEEMIGLAARSGADAVKFQTIVPHKLCSATDQDRVKHFKKFQFSYEQFENLKKTADREGVLFMSTPFDIESVNFLNELVPAFKVASGDLTFFPMLEAIAKTKKPIAFSCGASTLEETRTTLEFIRSIWAKIGKPLNDVAVLHCVTSYPTPPEGANLKAIEDLKQLDTTVGYSDHTIGITAAIVAVGLGARFIEKHFTIDKNYSAFRDHQISADPKDMAEMVSRIREADLMLGSSGKAIQECETANIERVRRSIVAGRALSKGTIVAMADLNWVRPANGLAPGREGELLGKKLLRDIAEGEIIVNGDVS